MAYWLGETLRCVDRVRVVLDSANRDPPAVRPTKPSPRTPPKRGSLDALPSPLLIRSGCLVDETLKHCLSQFEYARAKTVAEEVESPLDLVDECLVRTLFKAQRSQHLFKALTAPHSFKRMGASTGMSSMKRTCCPIRVQPSSVALFLDPVAPGVPDVCTGRPIAVLTNPGHIPWDRILYWKRKDNLRKNVD
jgi:hypothetical protein